MCGSTPNRNIFVILFEIAPGNIIILKDPESCSDFDVEKLLYYSQYACGNGRDLIIKLDIEGFISLKRKITSSILGIWCVDLIGIYPNFNF